MLEHEDLLLIFETAPGILKRLQIGVLADFQDVADWFGAARVPQFKIHLVLPGNFSLQRLRANQRAVRGHLIWSALRRHLGAAGLQRVHA